MSLHRRVRQTARLTDLARAQAVSRTWNWPSRAPAARSWTGRKLSSSSLKSQVSRVETQVLRLVESLKRWCAARIHDPAYRHWVIFRFPETLDYWRLVDVQRPEPELPEAMLGPDWRLRQRDGFKLTDARMKPREILSEIHYCVLCHERDKDSCSKGLREKDGRFRSTRSASS